MQWVKNPTVATWVTAEAWILIPGLALWVKGFSTATAAAQIQCLETFICSMCRHYFKKFNNFFYY